MGEFDNGKLRVTVEKHDTYAVIRKFNKSSSGREWRTNYTVFAEEVPFLLEELAYLKESRANDG